MEKMSVVGCIIFSVIQKRYVESLYNELFYAIIPSYLFPYCLPFCYPYIL